MIDFNLSKSIGFEIWAFIPEAMLAFTSSSKAFAVIAKIGIFANVGSLKKDFQRRIFKENFLSFPDPLYNKPLVVLYYLEH